MENIRNPAPAGSVPDQPEITHHGGLVQIPDYLQATYSWAYLHPASIWLFEREWVVNLILWGNMRRLTESVLEEIDQQVAGPALQMACVYGDFSRLLANRMQERGSSLHIVDVAPIQVRNAREKLIGQANTHFHVDDCSALRFDDAQFACTVVFFLLHEQPEAVRRDTVAEAIRVTRPGGKVIVVDYHLPRPANPLRYLMRPILRLLEPFALDLWRTGIAEILPPGRSPRQIRHRQYFGGLYQKVTITL